MARFTLKRLLGWERHPHQGHRDHGWAESRRRLLPSYRDEPIQPAISPEVVTEIALRLRHLIEQCVPCELEEDQITRPHSKIITKKVIGAARDAGGSEHRACVVFCLLINRRWWKHQALAELWDCDLHNVRATACEVIAKQLSVPSYPVSLCTGVYKV